MEKTRVNFMKTSSFCVPAHKIMVSILLISLVFLTGSVKVYALASSNPRIYASSTTHEKVITATDLESFTDELLTQQLQKYQIVGASIAVVQDGRIVLAKGYGYADIEKQVPVSPEETIFRIGSTSKLFTWTAVMQLAEQGKIDLEADVNTYLTDFKIPATFPEPITMLNLLSHTAGFEERATGTESSSPGKMISLQDYLATYMPDRVRPAGELSTYSNYGAALAGYIVETVSGMPFEQYIDTYIFAPLSMTHSTFRQPLPQDLANHLASSYSYNGGFLKGIFTYPNLAPAATMSSTARDMANFMIAHLEGGRFEDSQILKPETTALMQTQLFTNDERLDGLTYGFIEETVNGMRVLWHGGDIGNWHSILAIIPDKNMGFFVSYNSNEGYAAANEFFYAILNAYFPAQEDNDPTPTENYAQGTFDFSGEYRSTRSFYNHIERVSSFPGKSDFKITKNPDHSISIAGQTFTQVEPLVYASSDGSGMLVFHKDGRSVYMYSSGNPLFAYERVRWYETSTFNLLAFGICYGLLLTFILAALIGIFRRQRGTEVRLRLPRLARIWSVILSLVFLLVPVVTIFYTKFDLKSPFPFYMVIVLATVLTASILVIAPVIFTILAWIRRYWGLAGRVHYTLTTIAMLGMVWLMYYWRLLGFRY